MTDDFTLKTIKACISDDLINRTRQHFENLKRFSLKTLDIQTTEHQNIDRFIRKLLTAQQSAWGCWQGRVTGKVPLPDPWEEPISNVMYPHYRSECGQYAEHVFLAEQGFEPAGRYSIYLSTLLLDKTNLGKGHRSAIAGFITVHDLRRKLQLLTLTAIEYKDKAPSYDPNNESFQLPFTPEDIKDAANLLGDTVTVVSLAPKDNHYVVIHRKPNDASDADNPYRWCLRNGVYRQFIGRSYRPYHITVTALMGGAITMLPTKRHSERVVNEIIEDLHSFRRALSNTPPILHTKRSTSTLVPHKKDRWLKNNELAINKLTSLKSAAQGSSSFSIIKRPKKKTTNELVNELTDLLQQPHATDQFREVNEFLVAYQKSLNAPTEIEPTLSLKVNYSHRRTIVMRLFYEVLVGVATKTQTEGKELKDLFFRMLDRQVRKDDLRHFSHLMPESSTGSLWQVIQNDINSKGLLFQGLFLSKDQLSFGDIAIDISCLKVALMREFNLFPARKKEKARDKGKAVVIDVPLPRSGDMGAEAKAAFETHFSASEFSPKYILNNQQGDYFVVSGKAQKIKANGFSFYNTDGSRLMYVVDDNWLKRAAINKDGNLAIPVENRLKMGDKLTVDKSISSKNLSPR